MIEALMEARPNDRRGFVHKRLLGGFKGFVTGGPLGAVGGFLQPGEPPPVRRPPPRQTVARPSGFSATEKELGRQAKFNGEPRDFAPGQRPSRNGCPSGTIPDPEGAGFCVSPRTEFGRGRGAERAPVGDPVAGRFGPAFEPGVLLVERSICDRGMHLGKDGFCYKKGAISNRERLWPRGRKPLLTGGEMSAIGTAARAGRRLQGTATRLHDLGILPKPITRRPKKRKGGAHTH